MLVIDTCSLVNLVRYYLPFDKNSILFNFIKTKVESKEIIVIDKVYEECSYVAKRIVVNELPFLKSNTINTSEYLPDKQFFHYTDNDFVNAVAKNKLSPELFEVEKSKFLEGADAKLLLFCKNNKNLITEPCIITEETEGSNDNKPFKKIPTLCKTLLIDTITLPTLLSQLKGIDIVFK